MDLGYTRTDVKDILTLMNYNTQTIFKAESNSSKLSFQFCHFTGSILTLRGLCVMKLLIMDTLNQFDLLCSICQNHGNSLLYIICQQIQDSSFIDKTMNSYVCISLIFGLISFKFRIIIQIAKIKSFKQKKEIKIKILLKKKIVSSSLERKHY